MAAFPTGTLMGFLEEFNIHLLLLSEKVIFFCRYHHNFSRIKQMTTTAFKGVHWISEQKSSWTYLIKLEDLENMNSALYKFWSHCAQPLSIEWPQALKTQWKIVRGIFDHNLDFVVISGDFVQEILLSLIFDPQIFLGILMSSQCNKKL